jgi:excisionase family DNA binding protein
MDLDDLISQADAAELRGVSRASINELVKRGRLKTVEIGGKIFLYRSEVETFEPQPGGRPSTKQPAETAAVTKAGGKKKGGKK